MPSKPTARSFENPERVLPGAQFADSYAFTITGQALNARTAAQRALGRVPRWVSVLMMIRNALVWPFLLKTSAAGRTSVPLVGFFPLISQTPEKVVLGLNDRHLDFRLVIEVTEVGDGRQEVTASTAVETHNCFGRAYLAVIKPFHRIIVPAMLKQVAAG